MSRPKKTEAKCHLCKRMFRRPLSGFAHTHCASCAQQANANDERKAAGQKPAKDARENEGLEEYLERKDRETFGIWDDKAIEEKRCLI